MRQMIFAAALLFGGCSAPPLTGSENVVFSGNLDIVKGCRFIEQGTGSQTIMTGVMQQAGREDAVQRLKNRAIEVGGTHVITQNVSSSYWSGSHAVGDIYRC